MATGLGGLAQGLAQGLQSGFGISRAIRENDRYELERPELEMKAEMAKRKQAANEQFKQTWGEWSKSNLMDADGNLLPEDQMPSELVRRAAFFNLSTKAHVDNNAWEPEKVAQMAELGKALKKDGITDALQTFLKTGDSAAALKTYNSVGEGRAPEGTTLRMIQEDPNGPKDVGIFAPDGKMIGTMNQALFMMSADNVAKFYGDMEKSKFEQAQANQRNAQSTGATIQAANIAQSGAMDRTILESQNKIALADRTALKNNKDPVYEAIEASVIGMGKSLAQNPNFSTNPVAFETLRFKVAARAYALVKEGKASNPFAGIAMAREELGLTDAGTQRN